MLKVKLEKDAIFKSINLEDSGYDVCALGYRRVVNSHLMDPEQIDSFGVDIPPHETLLLLTGVYLEMPEKEDKGEYYEILEAQARPRSGISLKESKVAILGTIDNTYRGQVGIILHNNGNDVITIKRGDRVAQIVFNKIVKYKNITQIEELSESNRGEKGFGSSDVNNE